MLTRSIPPSLLRTRLILAYAAVSNPSPLNWMKTISLCSVGLDDDFYLTAYNRFDNSYMTGD